MKRDQDLLIFLRFTDFLDAEIFPKNFSFKLILYIRTPNLHL